MYHGNGHIKSHSLNVMIAIKSILFTLEDLLKPVLKSKEGRLRNSDFSSFELGRTVNSKRYLDASNNVPSPSYNVPK